MRMLALQAILFLCICHSSFGKGDPQNTIKEYLSQNSFPIDTEADAIILYEKSTVSIERSAKGNFEQIAHTYRLIKILKPAAISAGDVSLSYGSYAKIENIGGATYDLKNNNVSEIKITSNAIHTRQLTDNSYETAFSLPEVKEGSVIEYYYDKRSALQTLQSAWYFQNEYPTLRSEYEIIYPGDYGFTFVAQGLQFKEYKTQEEAEKNNDSSYHVVTYASNNRTSSLWVRRYTHNLKDEPYCGNVNNYLERIQIQLSSIAYNNEGYINTWDKLNNLLWEREQLGGQVSGKNNFLSRLVDSLVRNKTDTVDKAKSIFNYVRNNIESNQYNGFYADADIKDILKNRKGNGAGINLLLVAMLRNAGLEAYPIVLATTGMLRADSVYPLLNSFNYTAGIVKIGGQNYFLDASDPFNVFGNLPVYCYNGYARIIKPRKGEGVFLSSNNVTDKTVYAVTINGITDSSIKVDITEKIGTISSAAIRSMLKKNPKAKEVLLNERTKRFMEKGVVAHYDIVNLDDKDASLIVKYSFQVTSDKHSGVYYLPADYVKIFSDNPFKELHRKLPVEFPHQEDFMCVLTVQLPANYTVDDLPQSTIMNYQDNDMVFAEQVNYTKELNVISANTRFKINQTFYPANGYETMRTFFEKLIQQEGGMIMLKKI